MLLLNLHRIAREGEGLAPELFSLLGQRSALSVNTNIVNLREFNPAIPDAAGQAMCTPSRMKQENIPERRVGTEA